MSIFSLSTHDNSVCEAVFPAAHTIWTFSAFAHTLPQWCHACLIRQSTLYYLHITTFLETPHSQHRYVYIQIKPCMGRYMLQKHTFMQDIALATSNLVVDLEVDHTSRAATR